MKAKTQSGKSPSKRKASSQSSKETLRNIPSGMLMDIYWAENVLTKALPKTAKAAYHNDLKAAFELHLKETSDQIEEAETDVALTFLPEKINSWLLR